MKPHPEHRLLRAALIMAALVGGATAVTLLAWAYL